MRERIAMPYARLFYHIVWTTKYRQPLITEANREAILKAIASKAIALHGICHAINAVSDHVHLVASIPPSMPLGTWIGQVKGNSSHLASRLFGEGMNEPFEWQNGYAVLTVSESHLERVIQYVLNQQKHHNEGTLHPRLERCEEEQPAIPSRR
jgi:putative transposase